MQEYFDCIKAQLETRRNLLQVDLEAARSDAQKKLVTKLQMLESQISCLRTSCDFSAK